MKVAPVADIPLVVGADIPQIYISLDVGTTMHGNRESTLTVKNSLLSTSTSIYLSKVTAI